MSRFFVVLVFAFLTLSSVTVFGQNPTSSQTPKNDEIIRISSNLVLIDALVLDKKGQQVKDLLPQDFEIYQDGKLQKITNFSYIDEKKSISYEKVSEKRKNKNIILPPPINFPADRGRIITFVFDNQCGSLSSNVSARQSIRKFIDRDMLPGDRIAIYQTLNRGNLFQMYTSNKEILRRTLKKIRWYPDSNPLYYVNGLTDGKAETKEFLKNIKANSIYQQIKVTSAVLKFVVKRLRNIPRRKMIFFISDCNYLQNLEGRQYFPMIGLLRETADAAIRSSAVLYTMNSSGLTVPGFIGADSNVGITIPNTSEGSGFRTSLTGTNQGLAYLANQTGGKFFKDKNFLDKAFRDVLKMERGYYLIGYQPDTDTFEGKKFYKLEVKLKRDDLKVSSRKGFFSIENKRKSRFESKSSESPLYEAITSPFYRNNLAPKLTIFPGIDSLRGNFIRTIFQIDGKNLTFIDQPDGMKKVELDVVTVVIDEKGRIANEFNRTHPIRIPKQGVEIIRQNGLDYSTDIPIKNSGFYSLRLAVRDKPSNRIGSAGNFVKIENIKKRKNFFIYGLTTTGITSKGKPFIPRQRTKASSFAPVLLKSVPSIRQYKAGEPFAYIYGIYNAKVNPKSGKSVLTTRFRLFKNGKTLISSEEKLLKVSTRHDKYRINGHGFLRLNPKAEAGEYILQLIVKDKLTRKISTNWINFEIIN